MGDLSYRVVAQESGGGGLSLGLSHGKVERGLGLRLSHRKVRKESKLTG